MDRRYRIYIHDLVTQASLEVQFVPIEVQIETNSNFVAIQPPGRNNPIYHYTGSEDKVSFTLDWLAIQESREDVIAKVKWVEALAKNDGYENPPHPVLLIWGDGRIFGVDDSDNTWLCTAISTRLSLFDRQFTMTPRQAYQDVTFSRITPLNRRRINQLGRHEAVFLI